MLRCSRRATEVKRVAEKEIIKREKGKSLRYRSSQTIQPPLDS
jgi:hypothetical protein